MTSENTTIRTNFLNKISREKLFFFNEKKRHLLQYWTYSDGEKLILTYFIFLSGLKTNDRN